MGTGKRIGIYLVMVGAFALAGIRYVVWSGQWKSLRAGQIIEIKDTVKKPVVELWGKRYLSIGPGGKIEVVLDKDTQVDYGNKLTIVGKLEERLIDKKLVGFRLIYSDIDIDPASNWQRRVLSVRNLLIGRLQKWLPGDAGGLASGILLGGSEGLSEKGSENFRSSGLMHVIAASGYNVTVVAAWMMAVGVIICGKRWSILFGIVSISLYVLLAGAGSAVVRAGIMASLVLIALSKGRKTDAVWIWIVTGLFMVIVSPSYLEDVGWQLSIAATGGLLLLVKNNNEGLLRSDLKTTLAAQLATLPIILHYFGDISVIAPLTNLIVLWTIPPIMQITAIAVLTGLVWENLGMWLSWLALPFLWWMSGVTEFMGSWKWSSVTVGNLGWGWVTIYYLLLLVYVKLKR